MGHSPINSVRFGLFERRVVWWPTFRCWIIIFLASLAPVIWWWLYGESFLSLTRKAPADILVVEGWIGAEGIRAAAVEFQKGGYQYIVATGSLPLARLSQKLSYAEIAELELIQYGIPREKV